MAERVVCHQPPIELTAQMASSGATFPVVAIDDELLAIDGTAVPAGRWVSLTLQHAYTSVTLRAMAGAADVEQTLQLFTVLTDQDRELLDVVKALAGLSPAHTARVSTATVLPSWVPVRAFEPPPLR